MNNEEIQRRLKDSIVRADASMGEVMAQIDKAGTGAVLLCDEAGRLAGLVTDGDIRRAILRGKQLNDACAPVATQNPITVTSPVSPLQALRLMNEREVDQLPVLDSDGRVEMLLLRKDLAAEPQNAPAVKQRLERSMIRPEASISQAMQQLDQAGTGALLVCDDDGRLVGLLTDGDIRRAILREQPLGDSCETVASRRPIVAKSPILPSEALQIMNEHDINHLPVVDGETRVESFFLRRDLVVESTPGLTAVVMVGGYGMRLRPLTEAVPKPMLPVGDRPLLELTIAQLKRAGIKEVNLATHYRPESFSGYFGNGESYGVRLNYVHEEHPLGTAGGLKLLRNVESTLLVINGDVLTGAPFSAMLAYHRQHHADMTVGVRRYEVKVPFGVVECEDVHVRRLQEKPSLSFFINAGTYLIEPSAYRFIPPDCRFDMTDLIQKLIEAGRTVVSFPIVEYWLDIGKHEDYEQAQADVRLGKIK